MTKKMREQDLLERQVGLLNMCKANRDHERRSYEKVLRSADSPIECFYVACSSFCDLDLKWRALAKAEKMLAYELGSRKVAAEVMTSSYISLIEQEFKRMLFFEKRIQELDDMLISAKSFEECLSVFLRSLFVFDKFKNLEMGMACRDLSIRALGKAKTHVLNKKQRHHLRDCFRYFRYLTDENADEAEVSE